MNHQAWMKTLCVLVAVGGCDSRIGKDGTPPVDTDIETDTDTDADADTDTDADTDQDTGDDDYNECNTNYSNAVLFTVEASTNQIIGVDPSTAALTVAASMDSSPVQATRPNSVAISPNGHVIVSDSDAKTILDLDVCAGELKTLGNTGAGDLCGISFGQNGTLYALDPTVDELITLGLPNGGSTTIGDLGFDLGSCGLAYDCVNDIMYGVDQRTKQLFQADLTTGKATNFVSIQVPTIERVGLEYDPNSGLLLFSNGVSLYELNPVTGAATSLGTFSLTGQFDDLAFLLEALPCF